MIETTFHLPTGEEALFGEFNGKRHPELSRAIFQSSLEQTTHLLSSMSYWSILDTLGMTYWNPQVAHRPDACWAAVYVRVNYADYLMRTYRCPNHALLNTFITRHNLNHLTYRPIGTVGHMDRYRNLIVTDTRRHTVRKSPLEVIRAKYPTLEWTATTYESCRAVMQQCQRLYESESDEEVRDALWFYHGCFIDYCYNRSNDTDPIPLSLYPFDNRAFTAYDLPSCFHVLAGIPLWGEQMAPDFPIGKFIQKSLPFAGARRTLITHTVKMIRDNDAFWRFFSALIYCLLLNMYPESVVGRERCWDLDRLLRAKQLATDRNLMIDTLLLRKFEYGSTKEADRGCYIVFSAFRLWIVMMSRDQPHYTQSTPIDWDAFAEQATEMARVIQQSDFFAEDAFKESRDILSRAGKTPKNKIYRYRSSNIIDTLLDRMMSSLEKDLYKELESQRARDPQSIHPLFERYVEEDPKPSVKENILNYMVHVPRDEWLEAKTLSILRAPEFGGVYTETIVLVQRMLSVYYTSAKPKDMTDIVMEFHIPDFKIVCWYFHVLSLLNRVSFEPVTRQMKRRVHVAMKRVRHIVLPDEPLPPNTYDVYLSLCCGKIKTLTGAQCFGNPNVAYDYQRQRYVCSKTPKKITQFDDDNFEFAELETQRKVARQQRKDFKFIPCQNNPVLRISMEGLVLIYNKDERYTHCPGCGAFHRFSWTGFSGDRYYCPQCITIDIYSTCYDCGVEGSEKRVPEESLEAKYFCKKHAKKRGQ